MVTNQKVLAILKKAGLPKSSMQGSYSWSKGLRVAGSTSSEYIHISASAGRKEREKPTAIQIGLLVDAAKALQEAGLKVLMRTSAEHMSSDNLIVYRDQTVAGTTSLESFNTEKFQSWFFEKIAAEAQAYKEQVDRLDAKRLEAQQNANRRMLAAQEYNPTLLPRVILSDTLRVYEITTMQRMHEWSTEGLPQAAIDAGGGSWKFVGKKPLKGFIFVRYAEEEIVKDDFSGRYMGIAASITWTSDADGIHKNPGMSTYAMLYGATLEDIIYKWLANEGDF
jgi:hypothetical protein